MNKLKTIWRYIIEASTLQARIYHAFCLLTILGTGVIIPLKLYLGLYITALLATGLAVIVLLGYYLSRFKQRHQLSIVLTATLVNTLFVVNYFYNDGISGSETLLMLFSFFAIVTVTPPRQNWLWTVINLISFLVPAFIEYYHPSTIINHYQSRETYFLDIITTYLVLIALIRVIIPYIIRNYDFARNYAEQKAADMLSLNEEKNKLLSIIAHDMRGPLSHIQTYLELLLDGDFSKEEAELIKVNLLDSTRSTLDILTNLLNWSKSQIDKQRVIIQAIDLSSLIATEQKLYSNMALSKDITLKYAVPPAIKVQGNSEMLRLIVRNLINNAIKFTAPGGTILVTASVNKETCTIEVKDSGIGQPVTLDERVFDFSINTTYGTNNEKGVGLGLVLCKEYTEAQNGKIWFENNHISGTSFFVELPSFQ